MLKPLGEPLFRFGNYFVTDDGKATIKTVVGDEKVPTVIFSRGPCNPPYKHRSLHTPTIVWRPWMVFWNSVVLTLRPSNIDQKSAKSTTLTEKIRAILLPKNGGGGTHSSQQLVRYHVHDMWPSVHDAWLFSRKCTLPRIQYGTQEYAIINKFCDFTILHDKDTKYVRIYMKNIINCCSGECYVSCDHVMVRGLKRYAVQVVEVLLIKKLHFFS